MFNEQNAGEEDLTPSPFPTREGELVAEERAAFPKKGEELAAEERAAFPKKGEELAAEERTVFPTRERELVAEGLAADEERAGVVLGQKVSADKLRRARELRRSMTGAERVLWQAVRANRLNGWHFRRQQIIGGFIADFYCHSAALVIELDGPIHEGQQEYDRERSELIKTYGMEVIRFKNETIMTQLPQVLQEIERLCHQRTANSPSRIGKEPGDR